MNCKDCGKENISDIHTCSPQIRELSDEEIMKEWHWKYADTYEDVLIGFARAILKKASEK